MKLYHKLLLIINIVPLFSIAQSNFRPGYVLSLKGDTLKGYIDLQEWANNPSSFNFKPTADKSAIKNFTVSDIKYMEISHVIAYRKFVCSISLDETNTQKIPSTRDTSSKIDTVFLKVEQPGQYITLYSYEDDEKKRYYVFNNRANTITELTYRIYYVPNNVNNVSTVSQYAYKQQLLTLAQQLPTYNDKIKSLLEDAAYEGSDLKPIFNKINNTIVDDKQFANQKPAFRLFAGLGFGVNTITISGNFPLYQAAASSSSAGPQIAVGLNMYPQPEIGRSVFRAELSYWSVSYKNSGSLYFASSDGKATYSFNQGNFSFIPQFQYNIYNTESFKFYIDAGFSINVSKYSGNSVYVFSDNTTRTDFIGLNKGWFSMPIKAGIILKKNLEISLAYSLPVSISDNVGGYRQDYDYAMKESSLRFGLTYIFN